MSDLVKGERASRASAQIDHILTRFHETHRRELPELQAKANALEALGLGPGLGAEVQAMAQALERHMFKEEMRLFPMMAQGGNTLIGHLIEDLQIDHVEHGDVLGALQARLDGLRAEPAAEPALAALRQAFAKFSADLREHARTEDELLFPLFEPRQEPLLSRP
mgnify:FL=1